MLAFGEQLAGNLGWALGARPDRHLTGSAGQHRSLESWLQIHGFLIDEKYLAAVDQPAASFPDLPDDKLPEIGVRHVQPFGQPDNLTRQVGIEPAPNLDARRLARPDPLF